MKTGRVIFRVIFGPPIGLTFDVDIPETPAEMQRGLRGGPPPSARGMLFDFGDGVVPQMTMSGVAFPLDMVFIAASGQVIGILPHVPPNTPGPWTCYVPCRWVLELSANSGGKIPFLSRAAVFYAL